MALSYEIDADVRLVVITCGNTSLERWKQLMFEIFADPRYQPGFATLVDCRTATLTPSTRDVQGVVEFLRSHRTIIGKGRWAVVVEQSAGFGMARMASAIAGFESIDLEAFHDVEEALAWLTGAEAGGRG